MGDTTSADTERQEILFHFIKSNLFRVIYVDGAVGGISPKGMIQMALFNDRGAIPTRVVMEGIPAHGGLRPGKELRDKREGKSGIVREVEAEIVLSLESAKNLHIWLGNHIATLQKLGKIDAITPPAAGE